MIMVKEIAPTDGMAEHPLAKSPDRPAGRSRVQEKVDTNRVQQYPSNRAAKRLCQPRHHPNAGAAAALLLLLPGETHTCSACAFVPGVNSIAPDAMRRASTWQENVAWPVPSSSM